MSSDHDEIASRIRDLGESWMAAALRFDIEAATSYLAPEFTMVTSRGTEIDRDDWEANLSHRITGVSGGFLDSEVRIYGDPALMRSRWQHVATFDGKDWSGEMHITDVWVRRDGQWQVVRRHFAPVSATES